MDVDGSFVADTMVFYDGKVVSETQTTSESINAKRGMAMAYVWGRQDAGDSDRDTGFSQTFAEIYALAHWVTGGYGGNLQGTYHEWHETGRVLVREYHSDRIVAVYGHEANGSIMVRASYVPYPTDYLPYWPGLITGINYKVSVT